jgi:CPA2 family monovalent cation:H+ antiporter-2
VGHLNSTAIDVIVYLLCAILISLICKRLKVSSVLGYLLVGVLLGPSQLGAFSDFDAAKTLGEFGVVFLLFTMGLEVPFERLRDSKTIVFGLGSFQVLASCFFFAVFFVVYYHTSMETAILVGSGLALSSTAVVLQVLEDSGDLSSTHGRITFYILLFQDLVVVVLLVWLTLMQGKEEDISTWMLLWHSVLRAALVFIGFAVLGRYFLRPIYRVIASAQSSELFMAMTLFIVLSTSMATQFAGMSLELGAFLAGVLLAETEYRHQVEADIRPYRSLFLGLFFMTVGMSINPHLLYQQAPIVLTVLGVLITAKFLIIVFLSRLMQIPMKSCVRIALLLAGGGEFVFVLFSQAEKAQAITGTLSQIVYLAVVLSMALTPLLAWLGRKISSKMTRDIGVAQKAAEKYASDLRDHVIIVGTGRVGVTVHKLLSDSTYSTGAIPHIMIDMNMKRVNKGQEMNLPVYFGDARRTELFHALNVERARAIVITMGLYKDAFKIASAVRVRYPEVEIFVRVGDAEEAYDLHALGAHPIAPELLTPSFQLASAVLGLYNIPIEQIDMVIEQFRQRQIRGGEEGTTPPWLIKNRLDNLAKTNQ